MSSANVQRLHREICAALEGLSELFVPGAKLTFIVRFPGNDEADVLVGDDHDAEQLVALVRRRFAASAPAHGDGKGGA